MAQQSQSFSKSNQYRKELPPSCQRKQRNDGYQQKRNSHSRASLISPPPHIPFHQTQTHSIRKRKGTAGFEKERASGKRKHYPSIDSLSSAPSIALSSLPSLPPESKSDDRFYLLPKKVAKQPRNLCNQEVGGYYASVGWLKGLEAKWLKHVLTSESSKLLLEIFRIHHFRNNTIESPNCLPAEEIQAIFSCKPDENKIPLPELYKRHNLYYTNGNGDNMNFWKLPQSELERFKKYLDSINSYNGEALWEYGVQEQGGAAVEYLRLRRTEYTIRFAQWLNSLKDAIEGFRQCCWVPADPDLKTKAYWIHPRTATPFVPDEQALLDIDVKRIAQLQEQKLYEEHEKEKKALEEKHRREMRHLKSGNAFVSSHSSNNPHARALRPPPNAACAYQTQRVSRPPKAVHAHQTPTSSRPTKAAYAYQTPPVRSPIPPKAVRVYPSKVYKPIDDYRVDKADNVFWDLFCKKNKNFNRWEELLRNGGCDANQFLIEFAAQLYSLDEIRAFLHRCINMNAATWNPSVIMSCLQEIDDFNFDFNEANFTFLELYHYMQCLEEAWKNDWNNWGSSEYWQKRRGNKTNTLWKCYGYIPLWWVKNLLGPMMVFRAGHLHYIRTNKEPQKTGRPCDYSEMEWKKVKEAAKQLHEYDLKYAFEAREAEYNNNDDNNQTQKPALKDDVKFEEVAARDKVKVHGVDAGQSNPIYYDYSSESSEYEEEDEDAKEEILRDVTAGDDGWRGDRGYHGSEVDKDGVLVDGSGADELKAKSIVDGEKHDDVIKVGDMESTYVQGYDEFEMI